MNQALVRLPAFIRTVFGALPLFFFLFATPAAANTYYVSQRGKDSNSCAMAKSTTLSNQKQSISAGVSCLAPGDTLYIHGGTYTGNYNGIDSQRFRIKSGTSWSSAITVAGYSGETVVLVPPDGLSGIRLTTGAPAYLIFQDFIIDMSNQTTVGGAGAPGVYLSSGANHNRFQRLEVKNNTANGFAFSHANANSPFNEVLNCSVHDNGGPGINTGYGFYITVSDTLLDGNDVYNNAGYGFHLYGFAGDTPYNNRNVVRNNRIHNNGKNGGTNYGIVVAVGSDNQVYNNLIYGNRGGVQVYTESQATGVYNNTIYANQPYDGISMQYYSSAPTVRNNIVFGNGTPIIDYGGTGTPTVDHNLTSDPSFVNAAAADFHLKAGSAAQDTGIAVATVTTDFSGLPRPQGLGYDIGAFEIGQSVPAPSMVRNVRATPVQ